jgi:hypothetical protein
MNSHLQEIVSSPFVTQAQALSDAAAAAQTDIDALASQVEDLQGTISSDATTIAALQQQIQALKAQIAAASSIAVFDGLELTPWIVAGGSVANSAGNPGVAGDAQSVPTDLNAWFDIFPNGAYQDKYRFKQLGADPSKTSFAFEGLLMLPEPAKPQAVELDVQQVISGVIFNYGLQWDFAENQMRIWDRAAKVAGDPEPWKSIGLPCPRWAALAWHSFRLEGHRDAANIYYDAVTMNGVKTPLTQTFAAPNLGLKDMFNCAIQQDSNSAGAAFRLYIDRVKMTLK